MISAVSPDSAPGSPALNGAAPATGRDDPPTGDGTSQRAADELDGSAGATQSSEPGPARLSLRRVWWVSLIAFFLLPAAWALGTPYNGSYDEHHHVVRAAGVVRGQILVEPAKGFYDGGYQMVPRSLVPPEPLCLGDATKPATCLGEPSSDRTLVPVQTGAARYNPAYYAVVGWPLAVLPNMTGVVLTRLLSGLLCAAFLASALVTVWPLRRHRLFMLATLCTVTPILVSLNGLVNPNGLEIDAAVLLWAVLIRLMSDQVGPSGPAETRRLVICAIVAISVLALGRAAGLGIVVAIAAFAMFALARRQAVRELLRRRDVRVGGAVVAAAAILTVVWIQISRITDFGAEAYPVLSPTWEIIRTTVLYHFDYWTQGSIALFGYGTVAMPLWTMVMWGAMQGLLVLLGFGFATKRRHAYAIVAIPLVSFALGLAVELVMTRIVGYFMQGRYFVPLLIGTFFLAALAVPTRQMPATLLPRIYAAAFGIWSLTTVLGLYLMINHFKYGQLTQTAYPQTWTPFLGMATPYIVVFAGIGLMGWLVWQYQREDRVEA